MQAYPPPESRRNLPSGYHIAVRESMTSRLTEGKIDSLNPRIPVQSGGMRRYCTSPDAEYATLGVHRLFSHRLLRSWRSTSSSTRLTNAVSLMPTSPRRLSTRCSASSRYGRTPSHEGGHDVAEADGVTHLRIVPLTHSRSGATEPSSPAPRTVSSSATTAPLQGPAPPERRPARDVLSRVLDGAVRTGPGRDTRSRPGCMHDDQPTCQPALAPKCHATRSVSP